MSQFNILPITAELAEKWVTDYSQSPEGRWDCFLLERLEHGSFTELEADMIAMAQDRRNSENAKEDGRWVCDILVDFYQLPLHKEAYYAWLEARPDGATYVMAPDNYKGKYLANYAYEIRPNQLRMVKCRYHEVLA